MIAGAPAPSPLLPSVRRAARRRPAHSSEMSVTGGSVRGCSVTALTLPARRRCRREPDGVAVGAGRCRRTRGVHQASTSFTSRAHNPLRPVQTTIARAAELRLQAGDRPSAPRPASGQGSLSAPRSLVPRAPRCRRRVTGGPEDSRAGRRHTQEVTHVVPPLARRQMRGRERLRSGRRSARASARGPDHDRGHARAGAGSARARGWCASTGCAPGRRRAARDPARARRQQGGARCGSGPRRAPRGPSTRRAGTAGVCSPNSSRAHRGCSASSRSASSSRTYPMTMPS